MENPTSTESEAPAPIPVRAIRIGFYDHTRRRPGDEFLVEDESQLGAWMERLDGGENPAAERAAAAGKPAKPAKPAKKR